MSTIGITFGANQRQIVQAIRDLQRGLTNAKGTVTLTGDGVATTTEVNSELVSENSVIALMATTANAAAVQASIWITPVFEKFTINHAATSNADCTFSWAIVS